MGSLFSRPSNRTKSPNPSPAISDHDSAVLGLKRQRDRLHRLTIQSQEILARESSIARSLLSSGHRDRAIMALKRKRQQNAQISRVESQMSNIDSLIASMEFAKVSIQVFEALKIGEAELKKLNDQLRVEDVEALMDDSADAVEQQRQISEMLGMGASLTQEEENEAEEELKQMEVEAEKLAPTSNKTQTPEAAEIITTTWPVAPTTEIRAPSSPVTAAINSPAAPKIPPRSKQTTQKILIDA